MADLVYCCTQYPKDTCSVDIDKSTVFVCCDDYDTGYSGCVVLAKEDALDIARRINEAFGDSNA